MTCATDLCFTCKAAGLQACPFKGGALPLAPRPAVRVKIAADFAKFRAAMRDLARMLREGAD